jgi:hypothetical protein
MNARVIIAGNNREFPSDAAQSCAAYLTQMARPSPPCGLEPAARSVVLPVDGRAASYSYDLTAGRWIVPPPSLALRDAGAAAEPRLASGARHTQRSHTQTHTDSRRPARGSNHTAGLISAAVEIATVVGGMAAFSAIAFVMLVLA